MDQEFPHEEADADEIRSLEMLPGYKAATGDMKLVLNQTLTLVRRVDDADAKEVAVRILRGVLAQERGDRLQFFLDFLSCLQQNPKSLNFLEFSSPTPA